MLFREGGGFGWACSLSVDLIGYYGKPTVVEECAAVKAGRQRRRHQRRENFDDYSRYRITRKADFQELYVKRLFFDCEAGESINAWRSTARQTRCTRG